MKKNEILEIMYSDVRMLQRFSVSFFPMEHGRNFYKLSTKAIGRIKISQQLALAWNTSLPTEQVPVLNCFAPHTVEAHIQIRADPDQARAAKKADSQL